MAIGPDVDPGLLDAGFGPEWAHLPFWARMATSRRLFVRADGHVAAWRPKARGRILSATEFASTHDADALRRIVEGAAAPLSVRVGPVLSGRIAQLGISRADLAEHVGLGRDAVDGLVDDQVTCPVRDLTLVAGALGEDPWLVGTPPAEGLVCVDVRPMIPAHDRPADLLAAVRDAWERAMVDKLVGWVIRASPGSAMPDRVQALPTDLERACAWACEVGVVTADTAHDLVRRR